MTGNLINRLMEKGNDAPQIVVGMGATEYHYSDRTPYEVISVKDQRHVTIRRMKAIPKGADMSNDWELVSDLDGVTYNIVNRKGKWYTISTLSYEEMMDILNGNNTQAKVWLALSGFDTEKLKADHKTQKRYNPMNIRIGHASYYYDYEF